MSTHVSKMNMTAIMGAIASLNPVPGMIWRNSAPSSRGTLIAGYRHGVPFRSLDQKAILRHERRKDRVVSPRQQRKQMKAFRAEQRYEAKLEQEIANHEANADFAESEADSNAFERERRAEYLYEEHFS